MSRIIPFALCFLIILTHSVELFAQEMPIPEKGFSLAKHLTPDGSIKSNDGIAGAVDMSGYEMTIDSKTKAPKFFPKGKPNEINTITWNNVGGASTTNGTIYAIAVDGSGNVYVGGEFTSIVGISANYIAKWDGTTWTNLGTGMNSGVFALAVNGSDVFAGGEFTTAGGSSATYMAKWDGSTWSALGTGVNSGVYSIAVNGSDIYVGGVFTTAGGSSANYVAKWDGANWSALGSGMNGGVYSIQSSGSNVFFAGDFTTAGGASANRIAQWNGSSWSALGLGVNGTIHTVAINGTDLYAGGFFTTAGGSSAIYIAKWDGSNWSALGTGMNHRVYAICASGSGVYAGGRFTTAGGTSVNNIAKWDGSTWSALGSGTGSWVMALAVRSSEGMMYVGGLFTTVDGSITASKIARFSDSGNPLPVELTSFSARQSGNHVTLDWQTANEVNNYGFYVERKTMSDREFSEIRNSFVAGSGTSNVPCSYSFIDVNPPMVGEIFYRLKQVDRTGELYFSSVIRIATNERNTTAFVLNQNFPNPFGNSTHAGNPTTTISYQLTEASQVTLKVFDVFMREVVTLTDEYKHAGLHSVHFDASSLLSGTYLYRLEAGNHVETRRMSVMK